MNNQGLLNKVCLVTGSTSGIVEQVTQRTLVGRLGQPLDVAQLALFLASDQSAWISGQHFIVDGGITAAY